MTSTPSNDVISQVCVRFTTILDKSKPQDSNEGPDLPLIIYYQYFIFHNHHLSKPSYCSCHVENKNLVNMNCSFVELSNFCILVW